jgi:hypothetical protein
MDSTQTRQALLMAADLGEQLAAKFLVRSPVVERETEARRFHTIDLRELMRLPESSNEMTLCRWFEIHYIETARLLHGAWLAGTLTGLSRSLPEVSRPQTSPPTDPVVADWLEAVIEANLPRPTITVPLKPTAPCHRYGDGAFLRTLHNQLASSGGAGSFVALLQQWCQRLRQTVSALWTTNITFVSPALLPGKTDGERLESLTRWIRDVHEIGWYPTAVFLAYSLREPSLQLDKCIAAIEPAAMAGLDLLMSKCELAYVELVRCPSDPVIREEFASTLRDLSDGLERARHEHFTVPTEGRQVADFEAGHREPLANPPSFQCNKILAAMAIRPNAAQSMGEIEDQAARLGKGHEIGERTIRRYIHELIGHHLVSQQGKKFVLTAAGKPIAAELRAQASMDAHRSAKGNGRPLGP